jgi:hypothetical protein
VQRFNEECDSISDKANSLAKKNIEQYEKITKSMEEHRLLYKDYQEKRDELQVTLQKIESMRSKMSGKEMSKVLS